MPSLNLSTGSGSGQAQNPPEQGQNPPDPKRRKPDDQDDDNHAKGDIENEVDGTGKKNMEVIGDDGGDDDREENLEDSYNDATFAPKVESEGRYPWEIEDVVLLIVERSAG